MIHTYEIEQRFTKSNGTDERFDDFLDRVLDEFELIGVEADYLANLKTNTANWTITVEAENKMEALINALSALRTALHAASCNTIEWLTLDELQKVVNLDNGSRDLASA
ncbi:MAG: hypothetical protein Q4A31_10000 [Corynebacterium sp.]|uniref:hypothetical protein n=1 Tax=Corynebacterium sp. TaxID=1720 RepID=UPI0026DBACDA|nr:hypothetical protein [Corynebacterium sp.]MDO4762239.1 hypothetical protein [Corynebacterium sp.]